MTDIYAFLQGHAIPYSRHDHPPVYTVAEAQRLVPPLPAARVKNLFLRDARGRRHFLVVMAADKRIDMKRLPAALGADRLSFASADHLKDHLGVDPGAVTILALVNDPQRSVRVVLDRRLWQEVDAIQCHPLVNTATLVIPRPAIDRFLQVVGHKVVIVDVPEQRPPAIASG